MRHSGELTLAERLRTRLLLIYWHAWDTKWAKFDWYVTAEAEGSVVAVAGVVRRRGRVGEQPVTLGLLGGVLTLPEVRGLGLGSEVVRLATGLIRDELDCDLGVLTCGEDLVPFYDRLGWTVTDAPLFYERFGRRSTSDLVVMCSTPTPAAEDAPIDVCGLPA